VEPPVVATPCGPVPELVDDGVTGFIPTPRPASSTPCTRSMRSTGHSAECRRRKVHHRPEGGRPPRPLPAPDPSTPQRLRTLDGKRVRRPDGAATVADGAVVPQGPDCRSSARMEQVHAFPSSYHGDGGGHPGACLLARFGAGAVRAARQVRHAPRRGRNAPGHGRASRCHPAEGRPAHAGKN